MTNDAPAREAPRRRIAPRKRRAPPGSAPGTLIPDPTALPPLIRAVGYGPEGFEEYEPESVDGLEALRGRWPVLWVNVDGLADVALIQELGRVFGLHRLAMEDVINVHQRPKVEEYADLVFIVGRMVAMETAPATEQISIFLCDGILLTFQERPGDCFDPVRERIRRHRGQIRDSGADYLAYALLDAMIDGYFPILEAWGEKLEALEAEILSDPRNRSMVQVHDMKRDLLTLRRVIWPLREVLNALTREGSSLLSEQTHIYLRDCYDHVIQLIDVLETYREIASGLVDLYLSSTSARLNEVMKILTIIATIFIPLGFVAGIYGMNFDPDASPWNMPELRWVWGYPAALGLMATIGLALLFYFYRKGWIGRGRDGPAP